MLLILLATGLLIVAGCQGPSGSNREFRPGVGWIPTN